MITHSEKIDALSTALGDAIAKMGDAVKGSANPFFNSKYADLNQFIDASKQQLLDAGIVLTQHPLTTVTCPEGCPPLVLVGCETMLLHDGTGQWLKSQLLLPCDKLDPQKAGSAISYARRYSMQSILNMPARDDDGNDASKQAPIATGTAQAPQKAGELFKGMSMEIGKIKDTKSLEAYYKAHIEPNTTLTEQEKLTLIKQCTARKEAINKGDK
jgi:hypothetical protein